MTDVDRAGVTVGEVMQSANILLVCGGGRGLGWSSILRTAAFEAHLQSVWPTARVTVFAAGDHEVHDWLWHRVRDLVALRPGPSVHDQMCARQLRGDADLVLLDHPAPTHDDAAEAWLQGSRHVVVRTAPDRCASDGSVQCGWHWTRVDGVPARKLPLVGARYALVDPLAHAAAISRKPAAGPARRLLVDLGAAGPDLQVAEALAPAIGVFESASLVCDGAVSRKRRNALEAACPGLSVHAAPERVVPLLAAADLVVVADGSAAARAAACGTPAIFIDGQPVEEGMAETVELDDLAAVVTALAGDPDRRRRLQDAGRSHVDGLGVLRLCADTLPGFPVEMLQIAELPSISQSSKSTSAVVPVAPSA
ncbi:MAG: hypothetical protein CMJ83_08305 [Planctomycetes bacterium]|nr:hypothetical protein [Planctomycetota bacterium]